MKYWCDNSAVWTHFANAASIIFPAWEKAFAAVGKHYLTQVKDPELLARLDKFIKEELAHASAHDSYNQRFNLSEYEKYEYKRTRAIYRKIQWKYWLATMVSIEHLAASFSRCMIDRWGNKESREFKLFVWHAREELGHKSLAIDVWLHMGYDKKDYHRVARLNQVYVIKYIIRHIWTALKREDQLTKWRTWRDLTYLAGFLVFKVFIPMLAIYLPGFHPDNVDDSKYLAAA